MDNRTPTHKAMTPVVLDEADGVRDKRKALVLAHLQVTGVRTEACRRAGVALSTMYRWLEDDEDFAQGATYAMEVAVGEAELELRHRAVFGRQELILVGGAPVAKRDPFTGEVELDDDFNPIYLTKTVYSDGLLVAYMKANKNEYRDKGELALTGPGGGAIKTDNTVRVEFVTTTVKSPEDYPQYDPETGADT